MARRKTKKKNLFFYIICVLLMSTSLMLFYFITKLNVLETKYLIIIGAIFIIIYGFLMFKLLRKKTRKVPKAIFTIISIFFICVYSLGIRYIATTINFVQNLTSTSIEKQTYSVLVLKDSKYSDINSLQAKNIGFLSTNPNHEKAKAKFDQKTNLQYNEVDESITNLVLGLNKGDVDAVVLDKSIVTLLEENDKKFVENTKEIYTFTIYINRTKRKHKKVDVTKDSFAFYISGSDTRETIADTDRSDVNIIAIVNPKAKKILLVNTPRDYYVTLNGINQKDKLTHAGLYGVNTSLATLEDLYDIDINYYAKVSFTTLIRSVDVMGGIEINSPYSFTASSNKNCSFSKGVQYLYGDCALAFSRERKALAGGDYDRGSNQQLIISAMINKMSNPGVLVKYNDILNAINGSFETNMTYDEVTSLVKSQLTNASSWDIQSVNVGGESGMDYTYSMGDTKLYVTYPNYNEIERTQEAINNVLYAK